jgi:hypothetical protein
MMVTINRASFAAVIVMTIGITLVTVAGPATSGEGSAQVVAQDLLDRLLLIPGQLQVLQSSSHNKQGRNGDADRPLYKDAKGDDVIFDATGPGCVRSIWGTWFARDAVLNFYFGSTPISTSPRSTREAKDRLRSSWWWSMARTPEPLRTFTIACSASKKMPIPATDESSPG